MKLENTTWADDRAIKTVLQRTRDGGDGNLAVRIEAAITSLDHQVTNFRASLAEEQRELTEAHDTIRRLTRNTL